MKILLVGSTGMIGNKILLEALERKHKIVALLRTPEKLIVHPENEKRVNKLMGDIKDIAQVVQEIGEFDVIVSALAPDISEIEFFYEANKMLIETAQLINRRLFVIGGCGDLLLPDGKKMIDSGRLTEQMIQINKMHERVLNELYLPSENLNWTVFSPPQEVFLGKRTRVYSLSTEQLILNEHGQNKISVEDFAAATLDELEKRKYKNKRFTIGYENY